MAILSPRRSLASTLIAFVATYAASSTELQAESTGSAIWAKDAVRINDSHNCSPSISSLTIPAPDMRAVATFVCRRPQPNEDARLTLRIKLPTGDSQIFELRDGADELLWAPDSKSFVINGNENGYTNYLEVYRLEGPQWRKLDVTNKAQRDMVRSYPPCKALNRGAKDCRRIASDPEFNMAGIAWSMNSSALIVMSEVPCSSSYGGIMCQLQGYEIGVPSGTIIKRMSARELKSRWQGSMGWDLQIPDPPEYGPAQRHD